jgi:hypothetical protein
LQGKSRLIDPTPFYYFPCISQRGICVLDGVKIQSENGVHPSTWTNGR